MARDEIEKEVEQLDEVLDAGSPPAFEGPIERFPSRIKMEIEETEIQKVGTRDEERDDKRAGTLLGRGQPVSIIENSKLLTLGSGGTLAVAFHGNFFEATPAEREMLGKIADLLQGYENKG